MERLNPLRDKNQGDYDLASIYSGGGEGDGYATSIDYIRTAVD